jgi:hypothetical protein
LIPTYNGPVDPDSIFDPSQLSVAAVQVKYKVTGDKKVGIVIRPIGVPRNRRQPLPYLAILMELGNESKYNGNGSKIKYTASEPPADGEFGKLCDAWDEAVKNLEAYRGQKNTQKAILQGLKKEANDARLAADSCNRFSISVRGISQDVYGILRTVNITKEFATLLSIVMPVRADKPTRQHMRPLERLLPESRHTDWMADYVM